LAAGEKSWPSRCGKPIEAQAVPQALIRPFEVASDAPAELMETTMTAATFDAQAPGIADRVKTCARVICAEEGGTWRRRRMVADRSAPGCGRDHKTPGRGSKLGVRNDGAPALINSLVTGKRRRRPFHADLVPR
jgi:hypothetical protein